MKPPIECSQVEIGWGRLKEQYNVQSRIGSGTFGTVSMARRKTGAKVFAVKTLKEVQNCKPSDLREVQFYQYVPAHSNVVGLHEMFVDITSRKVHFVMELMDYNLLQLIKGRSGVQMPNSTLLSIFTQVCRGLIHIHSHGFVHRDLKPENILVSTTKLGLDVKIADFGLARRVDFRSSSCQWTGYVATRWYRAPEQLLNFGEHSYPLDIWALGTLMAETCNLCPIFPGSDGFSMIKRQIRILGVPGPQAAGGDWAYPFETILELELALMSHDIGLSGPELIRFASCAAFGDLILACLQWNPGHRVTLRNLLIAFKSMSTHSHSRLRSLSFS